MSQGVEARVAVFLDRDGVIVVPDFRNGRSYAPRTMEGFKFYPDALASMERLKQAGFLLVVVTNQPDVGAGLISQGTIDLMHDKMVGQLPVDAVKSCFHTQAENCSCRKPMPGMILEAARDLKIALADSFMVGDRASDIQAGRAAGCKTIFIDLGYSGELVPTEQDFTVHSIAEAAECILNVTENSSPRSP